MTSGESDTGSRQATQRQNTRGLAIWTAAWVATMAIAVFGARFAWPDSNLLKLVTILVNVAIGFGMIAANKRHLDGLDELQRKVQLEAMAFTLGVGLVFGFAYSTLDITNLIESDAEISFLLVVMALTYLGSVIVGLRKYA
jgi:hypothetical protein